MAELGEFASPRGERVFRVWHLPEGAVTAAAVLASPVHEEKKAAHRPLVDLARRLAARGVSCLRFDWRGSGDSGGDPGDLSLLSMREDLLDALEAMRERVPGVPLHLLGVRLGADLCGLVAEERDDVARIVLTVPIGKGSRYLAQARLRSKLRGALTSETASASARADGLDLDGHFLSASAVAQLEAHDLAGREAPLRCDVTCLDICGRERASAPLQSLADALAPRARSVEVRVAVEQPFWNALGPVEPTAFHDEVERILGLA